MNLYSILFIFLTCIGINAYADEKKEFDFQKYIGEGEYDLYKVEVDFSKKSGQFCFLRTAWSDIPTEVGQKLTKDTSWNKDIDMQKYNPACFDFYLYDPFGWFYSQPFSYGDHEYRFFFVGNLNNKIMKGKLYQYIDHCEGDKQYRFSDAVDVSAEPNKEQTKSFKRGTLK